MALTEERLETISAETSRKIASLRQEGDVLADRRQRAWNAYDNFPVPSREDEAWRRTDISRLNLESFQLRLDPSQSTEAPPALFSGLMDSDEALVLEQDNLVFRRIPEDFKKQGIIFTDMATAVRDHKSLVEKYLLQAVSPRRGKFEALNGALWNRGIFVYVPRGIVASVTLRGGYGLTATDGQAVLPHTLIVLEESAKVTYFDEYVSTPGEAQTGSPESGQVLSCGAVEIFLEPNAEMNYVNVQRWGEGVHHFLTQNATVKRNARLTALAIALGGRLSKANFGSELIGEGATSYLYGLVFGDANQHFTHHTLQNHQVPNTNSDLLFKSALKDKARSVYTGMIRISQEARKTNSYQACRNLLLSSQARANVIPMLEILADDVKCGHGATVGSLDDDQRFYLMSRGLSKRDAEHIIVEGFFEDVLQKIPVDATREKLRAGIDLKLGPKR